MGAHLKALLAQDRVVKVFALGQLCNPKLVEMVAWSGGFDAVWFDQEHVGLTVPQIEEAARSARGCGLDSFVRLTATDYATVMRHRWRSQVPNGTLVDITGARSAEWLAENMSNPLREWDGRGANDRDMRSELLALFRTERDARRAASAGARSEAVSPRSAVPAGV